MTIGDTIVGCWTVSFIKKNDSEESLEIYTIGFRSCVGRGSSVGRGAERIGSSEVWYLVTHNVDLGAVKFRS